MIRILSITIISLMMIIMGACSDDNTTKEADYQKTKKMVVDILQTEDGQNALSEILAEDDMKEKLVIDSEAVDESITDVLDSDKGKEMWARLFNDSSFVKSYAESMSDEQEELMKKLMNDSDFQEQMLELMQNPTVNEQMLSVLKGQEFRSHLEEVIQETLETPLFQEKIATILLEAAEEKQENENDEDDEDEDEDNDDEDEDEDEQEDDAEEDENEDENDNEEEDTGEM